MGRPAVDLAADPALRAAELLAAAIRRVADRGAAPRLAIAGGSAATAVGPARLLLGGIWSLVRLTWVDERLVPFAHESSNRGAAYRARQLDPSDPPGRELPLYVDGETADQALARVDAGLDEVFGGALDVLLLGLGEDGHIASLFPGHPWPASRVALVEASPKPPPRRLTLGLKILRTAREAILVVGGVTKEAALRRVLAGDRALPAASLENLRIATDLRLG